ncbi:MAG TPA: YfiR family protein [Sphingomonas sp.]|jgi:hypothetical protein
MRSGLRRLALLTTGLGLLWSQPTPAQLSEDAVKAAFLPRFIRYVTWPPPATPGAGQPFQLCVVGPDPFGRALDRAAAGQAMNGHPVVVRRMRTPAEAGGCHLAFVGGSGAQATGRVLAGLSRSPVLTVTDAEAGGQRGMIHFAMVSGRVRFFIDEGEAADRGLQISSRLLALAVSVRSKRR